MFSHRIGFGPRLGAALLDILLVLLCSLPALIFAGVAGAVVTTLGLDSVIDEEAMAATGLMAGVGAVAAFIFAGLVAIVYTLIEAFTGASPGKRILGLRVARADGTPGDVQLYLMRWALKNSGSLLTFVLPAVSSLASLVFFFGCFAALGEKRQALHDMVVKSAVYKKADIAG